MDNQSLDLGPKSPEPNSSIPIKVLIVEDQKGIGKMVAMMIDDTNITSTLCTTAEEGLEQLRNAKNNDGQPFDLVISDRGLPGMNGLELARLTKEEGLSRRFTIFTASAHEVKEGKTQKQLKAEGIDNVISKPAKTALFLEEVRQTRILKQNQ